jgi:2-C-methyl-D-erythritol 4-phosphate cytidylyltransferase / 2-C-methyl-D-erythritol 2,4-cyclodiphosphate synthase
VNPGESGPARTGLGVGLIGSADASTLEGMNASSELRRAIIVVAAGKGTRLGADRPKAFVDLGGRSLLVRSLEAACELPDPAQFVVVAPSELVDDAVIACAPIVRGSAAGSLLTVVAGGESRQESVAAGLRALVPTIEIVLVHDAARALTPTSLFGSVAAAVERLGHGVVPALAVSDTIKRVDADGRVVETVERSELAAIQTPQGFPRAELIEAYRLATLEFTDDAALAAAEGLPVSVIAGDPLAFKVTTPWDRARAEDLVARVAGRDPATPASDAAGNTRTASETAASESAASERAASATARKEPDGRIGVGSDTHAYDPDRPLWLCGILWPGEPGLAGHSDGDAVCHAITDALLSAAGLGDIGGLFGTSDPRYEGARGETFLGATRELLDRSGFRIGNVSVQLIANRPRFSSRRSEAEQILTRILGAPVSVSATTTDGLGFTGRGEGVAAIATALVYPRA